MHVRHRAECPVNRRGGGQESYLLLAGGGFGATNLAVTWVECRPGSQQAPHVHPSQEQAYVIIRGRGEMTVGGETREVGEGTLVLVPPGHEHAIRNPGPDQLTYVSATAPPFSAEVSGDTWTPSEPSL
jgi:mannose-6-phosphate isomerase-like protein (cupin superfamily)